jgi:hypothetical protein
MKAALSASFCRASNMLPALEMMLPNIDPIWFHAVMRLLAKSAVARAPFSDGCN